MSWGVQDLRGFGKSLYLVWAHNCLNGTFMPGVLVDSA